jgi:GxxExxY protein
MTTYRQLKNPDADRDPQTAAIIAAAIEVHRELGRGFLEPVYQAALAKELSRAGLPYRREVLLPIRYKGDLLECSYKADFVCFESIIVELKALAKLTNVDQSQVLNYLKATGLQRGLLINFGTFPIECKRVVLAYSADSASSADRQGDFR